LELVGLALTPRVTAEVQIPPSTLAAYGENGRGRDMTERAMASSRPGVVTLVGIVVYINAAIAAVNAVGTFLSRNDAA
jgi:hypothetical protein